MGSHFIQRIAVENLVLPSRELGYRGLQVLVLSPEPPAGPKYPQSQALLPCNYPLFTDLEALKQQGSNYM